MERRNSLGVCLMALLLAGSPVARGGGDESWQLDQIRGIEKFVGSQEAGQLLGRQGFVVTEQPFKQIFQAYIGGDLPKFITVDSAWHTYHVLLEDGVRELEQRQARLLREFSASLYRAARAKSTGDGDAYADLARYAAVALALQDASQLDRIVSEKDKAAATAVLQAVESGTPQRVLFFALPMDPGRLRAAGFYTRDESLRRYFAARQWYATSVFRLKSEAETARALHLALLIASDKSLSAYYRRLNDPYDRLVGPPDDAGVDAYLETLRKVAGEQPSPDRVAELLGAFRREAANLPAPRVNDQLLPPDQYVRFADQTRGLRMLPPRRLPSAALFHRTTDPVVKGRMFPSGIDLFAAGPLGCEAGRRALEAAGCDADTIRTVADAPAEPLPDSLHGRALGMLTLLQKPLPESAPRALKAPAWHDKQLWTALGAWAEQRHTWALHAKMSVTYLGAMMEPPGYVSPYPEFFRRLGQLARDTRTALQAAEPEKPDPAAAGKELLVCVKATRKMFRVGAKGLSREEMEAMMRCIDLPMLGRDAAPRSEGGALRKWLADLEAAAHRWIQGGELSDEDEKLLVAFTASSAGRAEALLPQFAELCDRLAAIAQKQLDGKPLSDEDALVIQHYGKMLGRFHFYDGNSWLDPRDDFPLVTPVFSSPLLGGLFYAGLARPEAIYVVVEVDGHPVLHRGAVLSYREFRRPRGAALDNRAWTAEVQAGLVPPAPAFTRSFRPPFSEDEVVEMIRRGHIHPAAGGLPGRRITQAMLDKLLQGEGESHDILLKQVLPRATDDDVPDLIAILGRASGDEMAKIATRLTELECKPHREALWKLVRGDSPQHADAAAFVLAEQPEAVDAATLAADYDQAKPRTRRLVCYLLGHVKQPGAEARALLLGALSDQQPGVRFQAALAVAQSGMRDQPVLDAMIRGLDDPNEYVAAAMARGLVLLEARNAAPALLARLRKAAAAQASSGSAERDRTAVLEGTGHGKDWPLPILVPEGYFRGHDQPQLVDLPLELIVGLGALRYRPAEGLLRDIATGKAGGWKGDFDLRYSGEGYGAKAFDALREMGAEGPVALALSMLGERPATIGATRRAVQVLAGSGNPAHVEVLSHLLARLDGTDSSEAERCIEETAYAIGRLLSDADENVPRRSALRKRAIDQLGRSVMGPAGEAALDVLADLDPNGVLEVALNLAGNDRAEPNARRLAVEMLGATNDLQYVAPLARLLGDPANCTNPPLGSHAAEAIATILADRDPQAPDAAAALKLARAALRQRLHSEIGDDALRALVQVFPESAVDIYLEVALDREIEATVRVGALYALVRESRRDRKAALALRPLLDEPPDKDQPWIPLRAEAANTIAALLGMEESLEQSADEPTQEAFIRKLRAKLDALEQSPNDGAR